MSELDKAPPMDRGRLTDDVLALMKFMCVFVFATALTLLPLTSRRVEAQ